MPPSSMIIQLINLSVQFQLRAIQLQHGQVVLLLGAATRLRPRMWEMSVLVGLRLTSVERTHFQVQM